MSAINLFFLFCYYGCLCFSGGGALTVIYIEDLVHGKELLTLAEYANFAAISQMTPGPIGINMATFLGFKTAGILGAFAATVGLLFVPYFLMLFAVQSLHKWRDHWIVQGFMNGIKPATIGLILAALIIFLQLSVFSDEIPWMSLINYKKAIPDSFFVRPGALLLFLLASLVLYKTKVSIISVIFASAFIGAFIC